MNYPIILSMPKHENITDLRKSLTEENISNNLNNSVVKKDRFCPCFLCFIILGVGGLTSYMIHQSILIDDGSI